MARSIKKGPYIDNNLEKKVTVLNDAKKKTNLTVNPFGAIEDLLARSPKGSRVILSDRLGS